MPPLPDNARQATIYPTTLENQPGCRSISDGAGISATVPASSACAGCLWLMASGPHGAMLTAVHNPAHSDT